MTSLLEELRRAATCDTLLVVCDYDGTLAPIVADADRAYPDARAMTALVSLAELPHTYVALLSGREVAVLQRLTGGSPRVTLIGSHGAEQPGRVPAIEPEAREDLLEVKVRLSKLCNQFQGARLEEKPAGVAFHFRNVDPALQRAAEEAARRIGSGFPGLSILEGKRVVEFAGSKTNKGHALATLRSRWAADMVVFMGDDVTDEDAFVALQPVEVGIKVGKEATRAKLRIDSQEHVAPVLEALLAFRMDRPAP